MTPVRTAAPQRSPLRAGALLAATALLAAGCSAATAAAPSASPSAGAAAAAPHCRQAHPAVLPHSAGTLTEADSGVFCLPKGQRIHVFLHAPAGGGAPTARWSPIAGSDPAVVTPAGTGVLTAPLGVTPGIYLGRAAGTAKLSSTLPGGKSWAVTIVVR